jgi:aminomethyltransferase
VVLVDGEAAGVITSGNFSPILERGIALAFLPPDVEVGAAVQIDQRGRPVAGRVVKPPFVRPST